MTMERNKEKASLWPLRYGAKASTLFQTLKPVNKAEAERLLEEYYNRFKPESMDQKNEIRITVAGVAMSGKTTLALLLKQLLTDRCKEVTIISDLEMSPRDLEDRKNRLGDLVKDKVIIIEELQLARTAQVRSINPYACFGRAPHPMDFNESKDSSEVFRLRFKKFNKWEEEFGGITDGMGLIIAERQQQQTKHGFTILNDSDYNNRELLQAANFALDNAGMQEQFGIHGVSIEWPKGWREENKRKIVTKTRIEKLMVAGAFFMAQQDKDMSATWNTKIYQIARAIDELKKECNLNTDK